MGFLSKLWKGVKKVVKKIGKGIKKVAMKVGKFMNKIGIVGQIAMSFLLPGLGEILGGWAATMMGSSSAIVSGAGKFLNAAVEIGRGASKIVSSVTEGVTQVVGEVVGAVANKIPGMDKLVSGMSGGKINITDKNWGTVKAAAESAFTKTGDAVTSLFSKDTLTGLNSYAAKAQALATAKGPNLTGTPNMSPVEFENPILSEPQMSGLNAGNTTGVVIPEVKVNAGAFKDLGTSSGVVASNVSEGFEIIDGQVVSKTGTPTPPSLLAGGSTNVPVPTESKLSAENIGKAIKKTFGADGEPLGDGSYVQSIDVPDLDQNRGGVLADLTERRIRPLQVQGLYASPNTVITSNWSKNMAQNLSFTG